MMHTTYLYSYRYSYRGLELPCPGHNVGRGVAGPVSWSVRQPGATYPPTPAVILSGRFARERRTGGRDKLFFYFKTSLQIWIWMMDDG